ncbi:hypothetical protein C4N9_20570 [Pararhodobacter marinus]|uniref:Uncharacterized protein n=1 Tax=Pararhodobacter marinus TaxID=2184063 RepID=A0A2U2C486_9RHOB|nr:CHC2 zinc finger domain-containing protein [Pararhodobacter marinus]PWE26661.1 hypothetical protein C4N9_20570 [Pararhodobacter marinus]
MTRDDPRLVEARARSIEEIAMVLSIDGLKRAGHELIGPCPECGGTDRFAINVSKGVFQCRRCGNAGDGIQLVRWLRGCTLPEALTWLCGDRQELSREELAERERRAIEGRRKFEEAANRRREEAIRQARRIWHEGLPAEDSPVRDYLALRGFTRDRLPILPPCLRYHPSLPYMVSSGGQWVEAHRGPAMLAAIQQPGATGTAVHRTWFDLSQPRGKLRIEHDGQPLKVKKSWGSKKGAAIRLHTPNVLQGTLVMAEGIETTLTAMVSGLHPGAAFWAGVDLGNIAGKMRQGKGLRYAGLPDMTDDAAFVPPPWVRELVLIEDGDSDPKMTRAKLMSGARRAMAKIPGLTARIVPCPPGLDLNDVLLEGEACPPAQP